MEESYTETNRERMKRMPHVLVAYAVDIERHGKPLDSGLPDVLRFVAAQLGPMTPGNAKERLTDMLMECAERCGNFPEEVKGIDPRAWDHLLVYSPNARLEPPANTNEQNENSAAEGRSDSEALLSVTVDELRVICDTTVRLTEILQKGCAHLAVENIAPEIMRKLLLELVMHKQG